MKDSLKYASYIIVALTIAYVCVTLKDCSTVRPQADRVVIPPDSAFLPVTTHDYRPNPLPFSGNSKPDVKLPKGVKESDVSRTITVVNKADAKSTIIIETKSGEIFIPKQKDSLSIFVTNYFPAVVAFELHPGLGISLDLSGKFSPSVCITLLKWYGIVDAPVVIADLRAIGCGVGFRFYHDLYVTPAITWQYESLNKSLILNASYQL
jgi:hypothetical protein